MDCDVAEEKVPFRDSVELVAADLLCLAFARRKSWYSVDCASPEKSNVETAEKGRKGKWNERERKWLIDKQEGQVIWRIRWREQAEKLAKGIGNGKET